MQMYYKYPVDFIEFKKDQIEKELNRIKAKQIKLSEMSENLEFEYLEWDKKLND